MPRRVSSNAVLAVMALAVAIGALAIYALFSGWVGDPEPEGQSSSAVTDGLSASPSPRPTAVMAEDEAKELEDGLVSNYRPTLNDVLADGYKPPLAESGTTIKIDRDSLRRNGAITTIEAAVALPGKSPVTVMLYLSKVESDWRVRAMEGVK